MHITAKKRSPWWVAVVAGMASYLDAAAIVTSGTALVLYQKHLALDDIAIGRLSSLLTISIAIGALIGGRLGDRFGRRKVFTVTMILYAIAALGLAFASGTGMLFVFTCCLGFAVGADLPVSLAMIAEEAPHDQQGKMITFSHLLWMAGVMAVSGIGAVVGNMAQTGARVMYLHLFVVAVVVLVLRSTLPESSEWVKAHQQADSAEETVSTKSSLKALLSGPYLLPLIGTGLFYALVNIAANTNGQFSSYIWVNVAGSTVSAASTFSLCATVVSILATTVLMKIVDTKYRMKLFALAGFLVVFAWFIPILFGFKPITLITLGVLYAIGGAICGEPMWKVWSQELFPTLLRSTAQGATTAFTRVVAAIVALWTPSILSSGPQALYAFIVSVLVIGTLIGVFWLAKTPKAEERAAAGDL